MRRSVKSLWLEYRVAKQFPEQWAAVIENVDLVRHREAENSLPDQGDRSLVSLTNFESAPPAAHWMAEVDVPAWFRTQELGVDEGAEFVRFSDKLPAENKRRLRIYLEMLERLADARTALLVRKS